MLVKMSKWESSPKFGMKEKKMFENHHPERPFGGRGPKNPILRDLRITFLSFNRPWVQTPRPQRAWSLVARGNKHNIHPGRLTWNPHITHEKKGK